MTADDKRALPESAVLLGRYDNEAQELIDGLYRRVGIQTRAINRDAKRAAHT